MKINEVRLLLYKSIAEKGLNHPDTIMLSKKLDKIILTDLKRNLKYYKTT